MCCSYVCVRVRMCVLQYSVHFGAAVGEEVLDKRFGDFGHFDFDLGATVSRSQLFGALLRLLCCLAVVPVLYGCVA